jgi:enoyl-CoA hydratase
MTSEERDDAEHAAGSTNRVSAVSGEAVRYEVDGHVATITMNRPEVLNAQNTALIDGIDHCLDLADADDEVRVVILAGEGKHFSTGHDLKALVTGEGADDWVAMRQTPEGKFRHEQVMYYERCLRLYSFRKPTIAQVQGAAVAAGLMLACMCDLIVAADDAMFSNPVLRMTGAGVELLVEPWELGLRKAKEFLWTGEKIDAQEAWRLGLVNRVVPAAELAERTRELAERVALVPPTTAQVVKDTINNTATLMGKEQSWKYHFIAHHWMHNTATALNALAQRQTKSSMKEVFAEHQDG